MNPRVVIVGLDAATFSLIEQFAQAGLLPQMQQMQQQGTAGLLLSTPNMHSASSWTSIITGQNPGKHGIYVFSERDFASNEQLIYTGADRKCDTIFRHLARQGRSAGMINVPMSYPAESAPQSFMVSGLDAPVFDERAFSSKELRREVLESFPDYNPTPPELPQIMAAQDLDGAINTWKKLVRTRTDTAKYLLGRYRPEFFMVVYTATDWVQHYFWKYTEPRHPEYDAEQAVRYRDTIRDFYQLMDNIIGELRQVAGPQANVIVVSDHGMGHHNQGSFHIVEYLEQVGLLALRPLEKAAAEPARGGMMEDLSRSARQVAKSILPAGMRETLKNMVGEKSAPLVSKDKFYGRVIWEKTVAYSEHGRNVVNINLKGRNKFGIVEPQDFDRTCDQVIAQLLEWRDPDTGLPVVKAVKKRAEMYHGPYTQHSSDLYVHWNGEVILQRPAPEVIQRRKFWWNGTHRPHGVFLAIGPDIKPASQPQEACVYDVVPTVLQLLGAEIPANLDGRILHEVLLATSTKAPAAANAATTNTSVDSSTQTASPTTTSTISSPEEASTELSEEEQADVAEKLRGLGYL
jgi:predicted AlkP superfamily phosphohydrolase/phosphomutase